MTPDINDLIARLQAAHSARLARRDLPGTFSETQKDAYVAETARTAATLSALKNIENDLAKPLRLIADIEAKRAATIAKQAEIEQQIAEAPDWRSFSDRRARDREWVRQNELKQQLKLLHENRLLYAPGQVFENVADLDARIAELNQKIAQHRATHEAHVEAAEALLGETVTT